MELLTSLLQGCPGYRELWELAGKGKPTAVSGMTGISRAHWISALHEALGQPVLAICRDEEAASALRDALSGFTGMQPPALPVRDYTFYEASAVSRGWEQQRLHWMWEAQSAGDIRVASLQAISAYTLPPETLRDRGVLSLSPEAEPCPPEQVCDRLNAMGYSRCSLVEGVGQYALRGGILDLWSPGAELPVRVEFFGDEVDTMGSFDPLTQRRTENLSELTVLPVSEVLPGLHRDGRDGLQAAMKKEIAAQKRKKEPNEKLLSLLEADLDKLENGLSFAAWDRYLNLIYPEPACALDYLPARTLVVFCDWSSLLSADKAIGDDLQLGLRALIEDGLLCGNLASYRFPLERLLGRLGGRTVVYMDSFLPAAYPDSCPPKELFQVQTKQLPAFGGNVDAAVSDLEHYKRHEYATLVFCGTAHRAEVLQQLLRDKGTEARVAIPLTALPTAGQICLTDGQLSAGMEYPEQRFALLTEGQLSGEKKKKHKNPVKATNRQKLNSFTDLTPGDLVVHEYHGIGRYMGMEQMRMDGVTKDYVRISYAGTDTLYVPATQLDLISKYIGGGEDSPVKLNKLGTDTWQKTKARAKKAVQDMAEELIQLYAERKRLPGYAFSEDSPWQREFEDGFPYVETEDQLRCVEEIKYDMEQSTPMDRLLCGDVGFGKTEVALRAAMKAILDGKQVAILVPTTVLAQQHYVTAMERFRGFPVNVDVLSRFRTPAQQRNTLSRLAAGYVDLIIGTHKLLQKSVVFKNLGLLIVDEEQRFGVTHKERLKELAKGVDVLTLSATPIPRTLNMAMSGIRDMSTIEEPPRDRYPVQTFVLEYAEHILNEAMARELERGGQVYYLHNRVETIEQTAARIKKALPWASIEVAHGKMDEETLSSVMQRMSEGETQILVCTTIIETGIDIPNVNTLIIEDADRLGLSQLHQIRGRVGRSSRHAFAYLTYRRGKLLTEVAEKRLTAIRDFAEFGSGFKIAMRDLEIRGAGNLLGSAQSGHMMSVGYDMYLQLLEDAVLETRGDAPAVRENCAADLTVNANIPKTYVENGEQRMDLYRRIAAIRTRAEAEDLLDELLDRYGEPPLPVHNLIDVALLRIAAVACGVGDITQKADLVRFTLSRMDFSAVSQLCTAPALKGRLRFSAGDVPILEYRLKKGEEPLTAAKRFVQLYQSMIDPAQLTAPG